MSLKIIKKKAIISPIFLTLIIILMLIFGFWLFVKIISWLDLGGEMFFPKEAEGIFYKYPILHFKKEDSQMFVLWTIKDNCQAGEYEMRELDYQDDNDFWGGGDVACLMDQEMFKCAANISWPLEDGQTYQLQVKNWHCCSGSGYISPIIQFTWPLFNTASDEATEKFQTLLGVVPAEQVPPREKWDCIDKK